MIDCVLSHWYDGITTRNQETEKIILSLSVVTDKKIIKLDSRITEILVLEQ